MEATQSAAAAAKPVPAAADQLSSLASAEAPGSLVQALAEAAPTA